ncbi:hypothetical protein L3Q82_022686 [Scortum barcoo]|uniref:Uncharacterized protein n=1 Tax=Scortum barcoo TaxID=214431 RepID=A0ACB8WX43_9TELE|nr:hypothetical protein L3Q82_022686 [Scortum barcoo]
MSSEAAVSVSRFDRVREIPHYDQVPVGFLWRDPYPPPPMPAVSLEALPPPPLPEQPAVGPESFYPPSNDEPVEGDCDAMDIKPVHRFIPDSVKNFFRGNSGNSSSKGWHIPTPPPPPPAPDSVILSKQSANCHTTPGIPCSPPNSAPPSPSLRSSYRDPYGGSGGSYTSQKERDGLLLGAEALDSASAVPTTLSALTYQERVEEYHQRYAYLKSWAGLLRILGCIELLLGAAVFACVCAYVHKDNEWFNMFGYSQPQLFGGLGGGASAYGYGGGYYTGPKTPFVLVVAGLSWIVTVILVVLGMTIYYRAILLDSSWWPLTECAINLVLAVLYLAAGIVYVRDTTRGGLCYMPVFNNGVNGAFCSTEAGQTAAIIFLFITMVLYLISAGVCLKLWRHEAARMRKEAAALELGSGSRASEQTPLPTTQPDIMDAPNNSAAPLMALEPEILRGHIPAGHIPKPVIIADYVAKYPSIRSEEERERYRAVFNDQYAEYKELHTEVQAMAKRFEEMDEMMQDLTSRPSSQMEKERISNILRDYQRKKTDPTYLEKRERCEYLKNKLSHIKQKIQEYNEGADWKDSSPVPSSETSSTETSSPQSLKSPASCPSVTVVRAAGIEQLIVSAVFIGIRRFIKHTERTFQLHFNMPSNKHTPPPHHSHGSKHHGPVSFHVIVAEYHWHTWVLSYQYLVHSSRHRHSELTSNPAFPYYQGEKMLHFYRWTSPPGVMKILCIIIIVMCVAVFACVASTLAWDYDMSIMGLGGGAGLMPGYGGSYGSSYGGSYGGSYGYGGGSGGLYGAGSGTYGYGETQMDPMAGKGFIIAIAAITFIAVLIIFVLVVSRQNAARSSKFYLATIIICAILAFLMIIATIVYLVAVNPTAQSTGSIYYSQIRQLCAQYQTQSQAQGIFLNQYLYHYCVVEPQEVCVGSMECSVAIAIVLGFLVFVALIILLVFAVRTRSKIRHWGRDRILWEEVRVISDVPHNSVGEWVSVCRQCLKLPVDGSIGGVQVNNVSGEPEVLLNSHNHKVGGSRDYLDHLDHNKPIYLPGDSDISSTVEGLKPRMKDYDTGVESGDDLEEEDFSVLFPPIVDELERLNYKREFDRDHQEYKSLQAELDSINQDLADLNRQLGRHPEGSPQFLQHRLNRVLPDAMDEYSRLKNLKKSPNYEIKKKRCKYLREVLKEDESGSLKATVEEILFQSKRKRLIESHGQVRLGMMRHLFVVIDCSRSMEDQDLKPNRLTSTLKMMETFVDEYFDQNPISQVGIITTKNKRAEKLTDLAGNPKKHIAALKKAVDTVCIGEPSLYNSLSLAIQTLKHMPGHTSREILIILSSLLTTCDPANIYELIKTLKSLKVRVSVIGLSAEVRVCTVLTRETSGSYHVILDESHFKELLMLHVKPPPASSSSECSLIRMGFPQHTIASLTDHDAKPSFSMSHLDSSGGPGLSLGGYFCPQCHAKYTELPVECKVCGMSDWRIQSVCVCQCLTLVSAPHLARSFHHLFPLQDFIESPVAELQEDRFCQACQGELKDKSFDKGRSVVGLWSRTMPRILNAIVAVCPDLGIGKNGDLPWHPVRLNNEFKHFRKMTSTPSVEGKQNVVIMGRKTWFSIPEKNRPLNNRINIVLSRERKVPITGAHHLAADFSSALRLVDVELADQADQVWVIGGSSLYKELMESQGTRRLFVTRILKQFESDTFLPEISPDKYRLLPEFPGVPQELQEENGIQYRFEVYESIEQ